MFDLATIDQIIDIRTDLNKPLSRFRSAVMKFSDSFSSSQWDEDFTEDADSSFMREVAPAILDIEEQVQENSYLRKLVSRYAKKTSLLSIPALAIAASNFTNLNNMIALSVGIAPNVVNLIEVYLEKRKEAMDISRNELFFVYQVQRNLRG